MHARLDSGLPRTCLRHLERRVVQVNKECPSMLQAIDLDLCRISSTAVSRELMQTLCLSMHSIDFCHCYCMLFSYVYFIDWRRVTFPNKLKKRGGQILDLFVEAAVSNETRQDQSWRSSSILLWTHSWRQSIMKKRKFRTVACYRKIWRQTRHFRGIRQPENVLPLLGLACKQAQRISVPLLPLPLVLKYVLLYGINKKVMQLYNVFCILFCITHY